MGAESNKHPHCLAGACHLAGNDVEQLHQSLFQLFHSACQVAMASEGSPLHSVVFPSGLRRAKLRHGLGLFPRRMVA